MNTSSIGTYSDYRADPGTRHRNRAGPGLPPPHAQSPAVVSGQEGWRGLSKSVILCVRWEREAGARFRCGPGIRAVVGVQL